MTTYIKAILVLKVSCFTFLVILIFAIFWNIFWPGYSVGEGLDDAQDFTLDEILMAVANGTKTLIDDLSD